MPSPFSFEGRLEVKANIFLPISFIAFLAVGCLPATTTQSSVPTERAKVINVDLIGEYRSALVQIDRPKETQNRYGSVVTIKPETDNKYTYEDGLFFGVFYVLDASIHFVLTNKMDHSIKIIWDEAAFIDMEGQSGRVMHTGVKYADRNAPQPPSVIPKQSTLTDNVVPTNNVYYDNDYGDWKERGIVQPDERRFVDSDSSLTLTNAYKLIAERNKGRRFGLLLPLEIEGVVNEYTFWFEVQEVSVRTRRWSYTY